MSQNKTDHRRAEVQQIVKNACDQLNAEGVDARNYVEQLAWLFFLKAFDETETRKEQEAAFDDKPYERRLAGEYAWSHWAHEAEQMESCSIPGCPSGAKTTPGRAASTSSRRSGEPALIVSRKMPSASIAPTRRASASSSLPPSARVPLSQGL